MRKTAFQGSIPPFALLCLLLLASFLTGCGNRSTDRGELEAWPAPIEARLYQGAFTREPAVRQLQLEGLAGEVLSAQIAVRSPRAIRGLRGQLTALSGNDGATIPAAASRVRYGGFLPVEETQTMTADPLLELESVEVAANLVQPVWVTIAVPREAAPGLYQGTLELETASHGGLAFEVRVEVLPAVLPAPADWSFYLNIWQDPSGVARAHRVEVWSEEHWRLLEAYAVNLAAHGLKSVMTSIVYDPWKSQSGYAFDTMVEWKYPGEYQMGAPERFEWDFTNFDRYVELMLAAGIDRKIDLYAMVMGPGSTTDAFIRYQDTADGEYRTLELTVGDPGWREVWRAFLPVLKAHLEEKGWFEIAMLGFDEKTPDVMDVIFDFVAQYAPEFKLVSSGGYLGNARKRGAEIVIPIDEVRDQRRWAELKPVVEEMAANPEQFVTFYTACWPYFPNTFLYSPLRESRLLAWIAYEYGFEGYTRWAVNAFPENVWEQPNFKWHSGDMYFVYPGERGPLDSMRWELLRQGIQDYEALRIAWRAAEAAGRQDLLDQLKAAVSQGSIIDSCSVIPWIEQARRLVNAVLRELRPDNAA